MAEMSVRKRMVENVDVHMREKGGKVKLRIGERGTKKRT